MADSTNPGDIASLRRKVGMTIGSATYLSAAVDLHGYRIAAINWASGTTAPMALSFQVSQDGSSFANLYTSTGGEVLVSSGAVSTAEARGVVLDSVAAFYLGAHRYVKVRTGTATAPVTLGATAHTYDLILVPARG